MSAEEWVAVCWDCHTSLSERTGHKVVDGFPVIGQSIRTVCTPCLFARRTQQKPGRGWATEGEE